MGLFDFLTGGSPEKQIRKHSKRIKHKDAQQEDRQASAHWLADNGTPQAILGLLGRYEMTYEHLMKDAQEKEEVDQLVSSLGDRATEPIKVHLRHCKNFARPMAMLQGVAGDEVALAMVYEMLETAAQRSELKAKRKRQLLIKLAEFRDPAAVAHAAPFLDDFDEGCRYAACEVLIGQEETPEVRAHLLKTLANGEEESNRLRVRLAEVAASRGWTLGEHVAALTEHPPEGWGVRGDRLVKG